MEYAVGTHVRLGHYVADTHYHIIVGRGYGGYFVLNPLNGWTKESNPTLYKEIQELDERYKNEKLYWVSRGSVVEEVCPQCKQNHP
jgi:hypothetical protein